MKSGVYIITNILNNYYYIGSSKDVYRRLREHKNNLLKNQHENNRLQNGFNSYGLDNFTFEVLEFHNEEFMISMEQWWMNMLQSANRNKGYNIRPVAASGKGLSKEEHSQYGTHRSQETKDKLRIAHTGMKMSLDHKLNSAKGHYKPVLQIDNVTNEILSEFESVKQATEFFNGGQGTITKILKGKGKTAYGYKWRYKNMLEELR
jgi:group I intron endonuclease